MAFLSTCVTGGVAWVRASFLAGAVTHMSQVQQLVRVLHAALLTLVVMVSMPLPHMNVQRTLSSQSLLAMLTLKREVFGNVWVS